ncbi:MAG: anti-sigma factor domain-containing protein, partial [Actinomycetota bacterium]
MSHEELQELIPSYALDALPAGEEMMLRAHLESCRECSVLLEDHVEAAGHLALMAPPARPPDALLGRILAEARRTEQVVPIQRRQSRVRWPRLAAAVAAAAVIALGSVNLMLASRLADRDRALAEQRRANAILTSPSVSTVSMVGTGDAPRAAGQIFLPPEAGSAAIVATGLPQAGRKVYQLWLL